MSEPAHTASPFDAVVFAGGGSRCLWQAGFWSVAADALGLAPRRAAGVSAGSAIAAMILAGRMDQGRRLFSVLTARNRANVYPLNLLRRRPVFPHLAMYQSVLRETLDAEALATLQASVDLRILVARPPRWMPGVAGFFAGLACYEAEKRLRDPVHPYLARGVGFEADAHAVADCATPGALVDLIIHSSCTPPVAPILRRDGHVVIDGSVVDNVPITALGDNPGRTLLLLTRPTPPERLPRIDGRVYAAPSRTIPIHKFDYASPARLQAAYDLGRADGEAFVASGRATSAAASPLQVARR